MALLALSLAPDLREHLLTAVEVLFISFVLVSFLCVAAYTARQVRLGRLFTLEASPAPLVIRPPSLGWVYILSVLALIYLQSLLYAFVVLAGVAGLMIEARTSLVDQFGILRLSVSRTVAWGMLAFGAFMLVEQPLMTFSGWSLHLLHITQPDQQAVEAFRENSSSAMLAILFLQAVCIFPVVEELFFRGFLLTFLKNYTSTAGAIFLSAGVFAFAHLNLNIVLPLWVLGIVLGVAYEHTGSILLPMTIHGCVNLATALSLLIEKGTAS